MSGKSDEIDDAISMIQLSLHSHFIHYLLPRESRSRRGKVVVVVVLLLLVVVVGF